MKRLGYFAAVLAGLAPAAFSQQVAFTSRVSSIDCPITISSFSGSKVRGFDSVVLRNDGDLPVAAVYLQVAFKTDADEEIVEDRRVDVEIAPHDSKKAIADLGDVTGLRQKTRSARKDDALAILSVKSVEFQGGSIWRPKGPVYGTPPDPVKLRK